MAQHGSVTTSQHSRHPLTFVAHRSVAHGVNTAMKAMQVPTV
jgi:hypothetical protein